MTDTSLVEAAARDEPATPLLFRPVRHIVRVTVEAVTPLSPSSGEPDPDLDAPLFRDWNGLPCLSGAALAGVIRSLYADHQDEETLVDLFGFEESRTQGGAASRLMVSFGLIHGAGDKPVDFYLHPADIAGDPVLSLVHRGAPVARDHVKIDESGVAEANKLFDRVSCPRGARFTLELALDGKVEDTAEDRRKLFDAVSLVEVSYARFGAAGRRGLGRLRIVRDGGDPRAFYAGIDRSAPGGRSLWLSYRACRLGDAMPKAPFRRALEAELARPGESRRKPIVGEIRLKAEGYWRIGQGGDAWLDVADTAAGERAPKDPDISPPVEATIEWKDGAGTVGKPATVPVPGSGVKGAIAHRTRFHLNRLFGAWAGEPAGAAANDAAAAFQKLFGVERADGEGRAGAVFLDDAWVDFSAVDAKQRAGRRTRNSIDRHTGGVRMGKLFTEEVMWRQPAGMPELVIPFTLLTRIPEPGSNTNADGTEQNRWLLKPLDGDAVKALAWALDDLCSGRLALGAREGIGDGVFTGRVTTPGGASDLGLATLADGADQEAA